MFLLVPAHPGFPGQIPQSRKTVVCCVCVLCACRSLGLEKKPIGPIVNFSVCPWKKWRQVPRKLRPAYKTSTYMTYIHYNFPCLCRCVSEIRVVKIKKNSSKALLDHYTYNSKIAETSVGFIYSTVYI